MEERVGAAVGAGQGLTVVGAELRPGERAPDFALDHFTGTAMRAVSLADLAGSVVVLNVVNSVDTRSATPRPAGSTACSPRPTC